MLRLAFQDKVEINEELGMLNYTWEILMEIKRKYPNDDLYLIIGADNLPNFYKWKNAQKILKHNILIIPRNNLGISPYLKKFKEKDKFIFVKDFKPEKISSTWIREHQKDIRFLDKKVYNYIKEKNLTISTMESCTGGKIVDEITNIEGVSSVISFSAVTYSNEYKIKMRVNEDVIEKYTVYSIETAREMGKKISDFTNSDFGIGITGRLNRVDEKNKVGEDISSVYISIYDKRKDKYNDKKLTATEKNRLENKEMIAKEVVKMPKGYAIITSK